MRRIDETPKFETGLPDGFLLWMAEHEAELFEFMTGKGDQGKIMIDVGAHGGKWAVQFADEWKRVIALEPNPETFRALCHVVTHYDAKNVVPVCAGAYSKTGIMPLTVYADRPSAANLVGHHDWWPDERISGTWPALILALDVFVESFNEPIGFIKIDTEGVDTEALSGASRILKKYRPMLLIELHEGPGEKRDGDIRKIIKAAGYTKEPRLFEYHSGESVMRYLFQEGA